MADQVKVALAGIAGYGDSYVTALLNAAPDQAIDLVGVVDPMPQRCSQLNELKARRIKIHPDLPSLYSETTPDVIMMATPIHLHAQHTCWCLERGSNVLCEKPLAATVRDARRMVSAEKLSDGRFIAIGYQWSFSRPIQQLKRDIRAGLFGRPKRLKSIVFFPRGLDYFARNDWAGRIRTDRGEPVFDSPANNATAHYLHNMFYLLGPTPQSSAMPLTVQAELYRANDIENYDTTMIRARCDAPGEPEILFYTTHAVPSKLGPIAHYEFDDAVLSYEAESGAGFIARFRNGRIKRYGEPNLERNRKIWQSIEATRTGVHDIACGPPAAMAHVLCVAAAQQSMPEIRTFPGSMLVNETLGDGMMVSVSSLHAAMVQCYDQGILASEHGGLGWATAGQVISVKSTDGDSLPEESGPHVPAMQDPTLMRGDVAGVSMPPAAATTDYD